MGRVAVVLDIETNTDDGENLDDAKIDLGGGDVVSATIYGLPGDGSKPLPDDYAVTTSVPGDSKVAVVGYADAANTSPADNGEVYRYSRNSSGSVVAWIRLYSDGRIRVENDNGYILLAANGQVNINGNFTVDP
jgi:hypothetical protein